MRFCNRSHEFPQLGLKISYGLSPLSFSWREFVALPTKTKSDCLIVEVSARVLVVPVVFLALWGHFGEETGKSWSKSSIVMLMSESLDESIYLMVFFLGSPLRPTCCSSLKDLFCKLNRAYAVPTVLFQTPRTNKLAILQGGGLVHPNHFFFIYLKN